MAQEKGWKDWYEAYKTRIAKVERDYQFPWSFPAQTFTLPL